MRYKGSCHCGKVVFEIKGDLSGGAINCNCSICARKGALLIAVPRNDLNLLSPETDLQKYTFHKHTIVHRFCRTCGMHPFAEDTAAKSERMAYVNIRCLQGIDLATVPVMDFDGRSIDRGPAHSSDHRRGRSPSWMRRMMVVSASGK